MEKFEDPFAGTPKAATKREYGAKDSYEEKARRGIIFEENGLYGLKDPDGTITFQANFTFIGKCRDLVFFLKPNGEYIKSMPGCTESGYMDKKDRPYVKNGKVGFKVGRKVIIPPVYDYIMKQFGDTVFLAVKDGREIYLDDNGREVLTRIRRFEGESGESSPFWLCTNSFDYITMMSYVGHSMEENLNVVKIDGNWVELERYCKDDIMHMLINPTDDLALTSESLKKMLNDFSYEFSFYIASGSDNDGLSTCLQQFKDMDVFCNSWYYIVKIWQAPGEYLSAERLRQFENQLTETCIKSGLIGKPLFAVGHDEKLSPGKVRMLLITHYNERCWPAEFEFEWRDKCQELPLSELMKEVPALKETIWEHVMEKYKQEVFYDQICHCIVDLKYHEGISWDDTEIALEYFANLGSSTKRCLIEFTEKILKCTHNATYNELLFYVNASIWALNRGSEPNYCWNKKTALDIINSTDCSCLPMNVITRINELRNMLSAHGAKTFNQLITERKNNFDYHKELEYIKNNELNIRD